MSTFWDMARLPESETRISLAGNVRDMMIRDLAAAQGRHMADFAARQVALGFRQSGKFRRPPEVDVGALMDLGS